MKKLKRIKRNKYKLKKDNPLVKKQHEFNITPTDRVINTYKVDSEKIKREITSVSYECLINGEWVTIVYYDNDKSHNDRLHVHFKISYQNQEYEAPQSKNVRQKGTVRRLNTWAVEDLKNNYIIYKRKFFKRSNLREIDY